MTGPTPLAVMRVLAHIPRLKLCRAPSTDAVKQRVQLNDSTSLGEILRRVWQLGDRELTRRWGLGDPSAVNARPDTPLSEHG